MSPRAREFLLRALTAGSLAERCDPIAARELVAAGFVTIEAGRCVPTEAGRQAANRGERRPSGGPSIAVGGGRMSVPLHHLDLWATRPGWAS